MATKAKDKPKGKPGRPSTYAEPVVSEILRRLAEGESLRGICRDEGMPDVSTVFLWMAKHEEFSKRYARAREEQADTLADEITDIADQNPNTIPVYDADGKVIEVKIDTAFEAWRKTRIDARKWVAAKLKPKKYGERVTHDGDAENPVHVFQRIERTIVDPTAK